MSNTSNEELARTRVELTAAGCDAVLLSSLANVTYISGFEVPVPVGALAEMAYAAPLALCIAGDAGSWLIVPNANAAAAAAQSRLDEILQFATFDHFEPADSQSSFLETVRAALRAAGLADKPATLGVEARTMVHALSALLVTEFPKLRLVEAAGILQRPRTVKTPREIDLLRRASHVADVGHRTLARLVLDPGRNEFEIWAEITGQMFASVGHEVPVVGELVTGPRTSVVDYPGGPRDRVTQAGDGVLMDISQRINGYWSDCTNTHVVGGVDPTASQKQYAKAAQAACEAAMDALRVGNTAADAWQAADSAFQRHGLATAHYAGHQIGVTVNELPRLMPDDQTPIQAGMVFSVEPGVYQGPQGDFGARAEKMVLVTPTGPEIMSDFEWGV